MQSNEPKQQLSVALDPEDVEKVEQIQSGLGENQPTEPSRSEVLRYLIRNSLNEAESGDLSVRIPSGEIELQQYLKD